MSDLTEFLADRLGEDEAAAKAAGGVQWEVGGHNRRIVAAPWEPGDRWGQPEYIAAFVAQDPLADACRNHIVRHDPARVLREVEAKRRIMARHRVGDPAYGWPPRSCEGCGEVGEICEPRVKDIDQCPELRDLASAYADHADYRAEWGG